MNRKQFSGWKRDNPIRVLYTLLDTLANCSLAFQRDLRHPLEAYLMLFLKQFQRLAHHRDKFVTSVPVGYKVHMSVPQYRLIQEDITNLS